MALKVKRGTYENSNSAAAGNWFPTKGWKDPPLEREKVTSTGEMLNSTQDPQVTKPKPPPTPFETLAQPNYSELNTFSMHDNRNSFQDHGVYFGHGLGRKLFHGPERQHASEDFISWKSGEKHYDTSYSSTYQGEKCKESPSRRRFPRVHEEPTEGRRPPSTSTTEWFKPPDVPHKTDTQVLVSSQEPHLKPNPWQYSYKPYNE